MPTQQSTNKYFTLETAKDRLEFDRETGRLVSFRAKGMPDQQLLEMVDDDPVFVIQYLDRDRRFYQITSQQAEKIDIKCEQHTSGEIEENQLVAKFGKFSGQNIDVTVKVRTVNDRFSHWSLSLSNKSRLLITDVQFPFVVVPYKLKGTPGTEAILYPKAGGQLIKNPSPFYSNIESDSPDAWRFEPGDWTWGHYPGLVFAQFLAFFNDRIGVYISCQDPSGRVKIIKPLQHKRGIRLGIAHVGDWPTNAQRELEYEVVLGSFSGDWYDAATLYRDWSLKQDWAQTPLHSRKDVPEWLLDSPPHIPFRIRGEVDFGPAELNKQFFPYPKAIPLLEKVADRVESPLVPILLGWEKPGPLIYPECFPPIGGEESLRQFTKLARERGWHIGTFCSGTRWATHQYWTGYDGTDYFKKRGGEESVCRTPSGKPWKSIWDENWRPCYLSCLGTATTRKIAEDIVSKLIEMGFDWIQFLDENPGSCTFPCYATNHEHPSTPGKWMTEEMYKLLDTLNGLAARRQVKQSSRQIVFSVEFPPAECFLPYYKICDIHVVSPGHRQFGGPYIHLFQFLYHEFILMEDRWGRGPEPYMLPIRNAYNFVVGGIAGAVVKGDGRLQNKDGGDWTRWDPQVGNNDDALEMLRTTTALRRGKGKDFLVYGRMLRPANVKNIKTMRWQNRGYIHQISAVFHAAWQAPDERMGVVLANWTTEAQEVHIIDERLSDKVLQSTSSDHSESKILSSVNGSFRVTLPALSCALLESSK